jgi:hypothetical protein
MQSLRTIRCFKTDIFFKHTYNNAYVIGKDISATKTLYIRVPKEHPGYRNITTQVSSLLCTKDQIHNPPDIWEWVSKWLLFNTKWAMFHLYDGKKSYIRWDDVRFVLDQHTCLSCIFIVLVYCNSSSRIDRSPHSDILF